MNNINNFTLRLQYFLVFSTVFIFTLQLPKQANALENPAVTENVYAESLKEAVNSYQKIVDDGGWEIFNAGKTIRLHDNDARIPALRKILTVMGDYEAGYEADYENHENTSEVMDKKLKQAVEKFQSRHGLEIDGVLGAKTQSELKKPAEFRLAQLQETLEKMEAMQELEERYILVNIPAFHLKAVSGKKTELESRIIVGSPKNATPLFNKPINAISFNPSWYVPPRIARNEIMEKLRLDPTYLERGNYMVKDSDGETVNASDIDWQNPPQNNYRFIQRSGKGNALGKIKFNLPETNNIYLHSTSSPQLFNKSERALSHGCIRVEMAKELAEFVVDGMEGWSKEKVGKLYNSDNSKIMRVEEVPVYLVYWTSWIDEKSGKVHFSKDIYNRNQKRIAEIYAGIMEAKQTKELKLASK